MPAAAWCRGGASELLAHVSGGRSGAALRMLDDPQLLETRAQYLTELLDLMKSPVRIRFLLLPSG
jgi:hypothetical protein